MVHIVHNVVSYLASTSNHNYQRRTALTLMLFLILHLHQTTTCNRDEIGNRGCFLSCIYIKPQPFETFIIIIYVVSYLASTSNHNSPSLTIFLMSVVSYLASTSNHNLTNACLCVFRLFLILHLHQTTTHLLLHLLINCCFLSCIYIKPQLQDVSAFVEHCCFLSCIYIKPQLSNEPSIRVAGCFLSCIYIKPQPMTPKMVFREGCFLSCIYIKPQHGLACSDK